MARHIALIQRLLLCGLCLVTGMPDVAAAQLPPPDEGTRAQLEEYLQVTDILGPTFSPKGDKIAFSTIQPNLACNCQQVQWHVVSLADRRDALLDSSDEVRLATVANGMVTGPELPAAPLWSPDGTRLAFIKTKGQSHRVRIYDTRTNNVSEVPTNGRSVFNASWTSDGAGLVVETYTVSPRTLGWRASGERDGFLLDGAFIPRYQHYPVSPTEPGPDYIASWQTPLAPVRELLVVELATGTSRTPSADEASTFQTSAATSILTFGHPARTLYGFENGRALRIAERPQLGTPAPATSLEVGVQSSFAPLKGCLVCAGRDANISAIRKAGPRRAVFSVLDPARLWLANLYEIDLSGSREARLVTALNRPHAANGPSDTVDYWDSSSSQITYVDEDTMSPPRLMIRDTLGRAAAQVVFDPNASLRAHLFQRYQIERATFPEAYAQTSYGHLVFPPRHTPGTRLPLVVVQYEDNGFLRGATGNEYPVSGFADAGFLVLSINSLNRDYQRYRQGQAAGAIPADDGRGTNYFLALDAIVEGEINRLVGAGVVDPERIAVTGLSAGSDYINFRLARGRRTTVAITSGDSADPLGWYLAGSVLRDPTRPAPPLYGQPLEEGSRFWLTHSPVLNVNNINTPLLINSAESEYLAMLQLYSELRHRQEAVEMYVYTGEYHLKSRPSHLLAIYSRNVDWLNFWLRGVESGVAGNPDQYVRWRSMREKQCEPFRPNGSQHDTGDSIPWYCQPGALNPTAH